MKTKYLATLFTAVLICSCSMLNKNTTSAASDVSGYWTEHWGDEGSDTDVDYVDTLKITTKKNGAIAIKCINNSNYAYSQMNYTDPKLSFIMENLSDPKEKFTIHYTLTKTSAKRFDGEIVNSRGSTVKISLKKIDKR